MEEKQQYSIERSIRRIENALRENLLSPEQISSLQNELEVLKRALNERNWMILNQHKMQNKNHQPKPPQSSSGENDDWRNHCAD